jgi:hypothetical protein
MCWKCGKSLESKESIYRNSVCPECGADLHCCRSCKYYAPGEQYDCRETIQESVTDKEKANFCDFFSVKADFTAAGKGDDEGKKARDAFNSLFGGMICI